MFGCRDRDAHATSNKCFIHNSWFHEINEILGLSKMISPEMVLDGGVGHLLK